MDYVAEAVWSAMLEPDAEPIRSSSVRPRWHARAACRGVGTSMFFAERADPDQGWRAYCDRCEVQPQCLASAMADPSVHGRWAGTTKTDRARMRRGSTAA